MSRFVKILSLVIFTSGFVLTGHAHAGVVVPRVRAFTSTVQGTVSTAPGRRQVAVTEIKQMLVSEIGNEPIGPDSEHSFKGYLLSNDLHLVFAFAELMDVFTVTSGFVTLSGSNSGVGDTIIHLKNFPKVQANLAGDIYFTIPAEVILNDFTTLKLTLNLLSDAFPGETAGGSASIGGDEVNVDGIQVGNGAEAGVMSNAAASAPSILDGPSIGSSTSASNGVAATSLISAGATTSDEKKGFCTLDPTAAKDFSVFILMIATLIIATVIRPKEKQR